VRVAAAADLKYALDDAATEFRGRHPDIRLTVSYGSSGNFFAHLQNQAPFDVFLSADIGYPRMLVDQKLANEETEFRYAVGQIVVWVPNGSPLDVDRLGMKAVVDPSVKRLAIANPRHAPYGRAAEAALMEFDLYEEVQDRLVLGENVAQTAQFVESGAADAGIIALSLAMAPTMRDKGRYWIVPLEAYPRLEQGGVTMNWAQDRDAAQSLRSFLTGDEGRAILQRHGFLLPEE
jgi:molybdate transport system substrate-binding protein